MTYSIDLSHNNDVFDFNELNPEVGLVICKATEGGSFRDPMLPHYLANNDRALGLYHFLHFDIPAEKQIQNFLDYCEQCGVDWSKVTMISLDIENTAQDAWVEQHRQLSIALIKDALNRLQIGTGMKPFIYTYKGFWVPTLGNSTDLKDYPLWVASYQDAAPGMFGGWTTSQLWQFSQRGSHLNSNDGGDVDYSKTLLTIEQLKQLGNINA